MGMSSSAEQISDEFRGRVEAGARHLRNIHNAPHAEQKQIAITRLAEVMLWLRKNCSRRDGGMDLHGQSGLYKQFVGRIRAEASASDSPLNIPAQVNHKISELLYEDPDISDEVRAAYGFGPAPSHIVARQKYSEQRSRERALRRSSLTEDIGQLIRDVEQLSLSKLDDSDNDEREKVVEQLSRLETLVRERRDEIGEIF
ncbi:hypothetical protein [Saccharopolyspora taberi]|uniref:Uncharacterized protein n=1 Tax=Saccharopolyspora taberi TaxID=60895 RepID=A0ABN3VLL3_9PSEU